METTKQTMEQPFAESSQLSSVEKDMNKGSEDVANSSILGKFDSVEALSKAYANLESEFTKKSQKLSQLLKSDNLGEVAQATTNNETKQVQREQPTPEPQSVSKQAWKQQVSEFLKENPDAKQYASEITKMLMSDKTLAGMPRSLDFAYHKILAKNFRSEADLVKDEEFLNSHIFNNEAIRQKIVKDYLQNVQTKKVPAVIGGGNGSVGLTPQTKPHNLKDAGDLFEKMLKQK